MELTLSLQKFYRKTSLEMIKGFINVASVVPSVVVGDCSENCKNILNAIKRAEKDNIHIVCFPELSVTGYSCADLFNDDTLLEEARTQLKNLVWECNGIDVVYIVGCPIVFNTVLYNCAVVCCGGKILGVVPKTYLPNYKEFYEQRWFAASDGINETITIGNWEVPFSTDVLFEIKDLDVKFAVELCEDLWSPIPPSSYHCISGADIIFNLSASNELIGKKEYLKSLIGQQSARTISAYVYSSCGFGESTTDVVFKGNSLIYENGKLLENGRCHNVYSPIDPQYVVSTIDVDALRNERRMNTTFRKTFTEFHKQYKVVSIETNDRRSYNGRGNIHYRDYDIYPFVPGKEELRKRYQDIIAIQSLGLAKRLRHINCGKVVIGVSGGLDSTLALLVCDRTFDILKLDKKGIIGVTMPCFGTSKRTYNNSLELMKAVGTTIKDIDITDAVNQHFSDIGQDPEKADITFENCQARERTQVLMDVANKVGGIVIGTGDMSELALGWCTYNGDHMSMYNVNVSIPKTLVAELIRCYSEELKEKHIKYDLADTLDNIIDTPISPELLPLEDGEIKQKTEDKIGPYMLHDFFLYHFIRHNFSINKIWNIACIAFKEIYTPKEIGEWLLVFIRRFFSQQFKRSCLPDGPKVGSISLSPRGDWRMPSDASVKIWENDIKMCISALENKNEC